METRPILDWQGNIIGELELPIDTPEAVWQEKLAFFAKEPQPVTEPIEE